MGDVQSYKVRLCIAHASPLLMGTESHRRLYPCEDTTLIRFAWTVVGSPPYMISVCMHLWETLHVTYTPWFLDPLSGNSNTHLIRHFIVLGICSRCTLIWIAARIDPARNNAWNRALAIWGCRRLGAFNKARIGSVHALCALFSDRCTTPGSWKYSATEAPRPSTSSGRTRRWNGQTARGAGRIKIRKGNRFLVRAWAPRSDAEETSNAPSSIPIVTMRIDHGRRSRCCPHCSAQEGSVRGGRCVTLYGDAG
jgi:hypothetical protein